MRKTLSLKAKRKASKAAASTSVRPTISNVSSHQAIDLTRSRPVVVGSGITKKKKKTNKTNNKNNKRSKAKQKTTSLPSKKRKKNKKQASAVVSDKVLLEKPPSYQIVNLQIPDKDLRTFSKHLFDGDDVEVVESDAETEEFPATVSDAGMHLSDRFATHEKYGFPEALLTFRGL